MKDNIEKILLSILTLQTTQWDLEIILPSCPGQALRVYYLQVQDTIQQSVVGHMRSR